MNFRQIKLLNDLEAKIAALEERDKSVTQMLSYLDEHNTALNERIARIENPPKRPRGRPPKVKMNG